MSDPETLVLTTTVRAVPAEVCRAFTHSTLLRDWLCDVAHTDPRAGGHLFLRWRDGLTVTGRYEQLEPPGALQFTWTASNLPGPSVVRATFEERGESAFLTLTHTGQGQAEVWRQAVPGLEAFWNAALENLASVVEQGIDLRQARRPRLGIFMEDEFTAEAARRLGVPVEQGVLLNSTFEGSGAQAAGLQKGDVLVSLNGVALLRPDSFGDALQGLKAGDRPLVEYYRGAEKHTTPLELGVFPIPELPSDAIGLAARVRQLNSEVMAALRAQLEELSEVQAALRPFEGEWSVHELVAHFILSERDYQSWVADMLNDVPVEDWLQMRPNVTPRIAALTRRFSTLPVLLDELDLAREETAAMIDAFPPAFARERKHLYRRAAQWALEVIPGHYFDEHREQFAAAIAAAQAV